MSDIERQIRLGYQHHSRLSELNRLVYPVVSRRSAGLSLGINLNPDKRCNFDCVYCQVERRQRLPIQRINMKQLEDELCYWLDRIAEQGLQGYPLRDIAIAGDGEPTTVRELPEVLTLLESLSRRYALQSVKRVLFTNGSGLERADLTDCWSPFFAAAGEVWFKLDYWDQRSLEAVNRTQLRFERLSRSLRTFSSRWPVVLQSCFFQWQGEHFTRTLYQPYIDLVQQLLSGGAQVDRIQAYTLARLPAESAAKPWPDAVMRSLADHLRQQLQTPVECYFEKGAEK